MEAMEEVASAPQRGTGVLRDRGTSFLCRTWLPVIRESACYRDFALDQNHGQTYTSRCKTSSMRLNTFEKSSGM